MYKMIIVDDENGVRNILSEFINNNDFGFEVTGSFSSAKRALEYLDTNSADLVLSDVKMPQISGIEFIEIISEKYPEIRKVIISGYSEFEYVKAAIKFDVDNYLLKPIDYDEIGEVLIKIKNKLDEERNLRNLMDDYLRMEREAFFTDLAMGAFENEETIQRQYSKLKMKPSYDDVYGVFLEVCFGNYEKLEKHTSEFENCDITDVVESILSGSYKDSCIIPIFNDDARFYCVYITDKSNKLKFDSETIEKQISSAVQHNVYVKQIKNFNTLSEISGLISVEESGEESLMLLIAHLRFGNKDKAYRLLNRIVDSILSCTTTVKRKLMIDNVIEKVIGGLSPSDVENKEEKRTDDELVEKALKYIDENYCNAITRQDIAMHVYMSKSYFDKLFKLKMGKTIHDYLLELRMHHAFNLLKKGVPVYKISEMVGYKDKRNFLRMFKDYTGYTPTDFKAKVLNCETEGE